MIARRKHIYDATWALVVRDGIEDITIRDVAEHAGVPKRHLYNLFPTNEALIVAAIDERFDQLLSASREEGRLPSLGRILLRIRSWLQPGSEFRPCLRACANLTMACRDYQPMRVYRFMFAQYREWLNNMRARGQLPIELSPEEVAASLVRYELATINDWVQGRISDDLVQGAVLQGLRLFSRGIVSIPRKTSEERSPMPRS